MKIADRAVGIDHPTFFIAEIGSNHDGEIERAKLLIRLAADSGADAAKFQSFSASRIVSDYGFRQMEKQLSHQTLWEQSVFDVYQDSSMPLEWLPILKEESDEAGVHFLSSPYDFESVDALEPHVPAFKIGSGEIDWIESLEHTAARGKPVILSTGASNIGEVDRAVRAILSINPELVLMQCNTNYTGNVRNFNHIHLNVLKTYAVMYPDLILGLSDHTPGLATCLGAVALGARMIEKHFTDDPTREGPDH
ncbi:MAG: N-acetylneuraminate synthase family protein, partial [Candidatus Binatia bacterium]